MALNQYIRLVRSDAALDYKFSVTLQGFMSKTVRKQTVAETIDGNVDVQEGGHYRVWNLVVKAYQVESRAGYGSLANLETMMDYNTAPFDKITFYDHWGVSHYVYIQGDFEPQFQIPVLDSTSSYALVPLILREAAHK